MKYIPSIFLIFAMFAGCKQYIQVFDTSSINTQIKDGYFVYENDTLKITYSFWASKGVISFAVYNKSEKPIYIDWKNSAFIYNDDKKNYWLDETQTNISSYYGGYLYNGPLIKPGYTVNEGIQNSSSSSIKPERITFIPPKSNYYRSAFYLLGEYYYPLNKKYPTSIVPRSDNPKRKTTIYYKDFSFSNSPLRFRNYLAFTFTENSQNFFFIDNEFYLTSIKNMDYRHFLGKYYRVNEDGNLVYQLPFFKQTSFYFKIIRDY